MKTEYKYIHSIEVEGEGKTKVFHVLDESNNFLGVIKWYVQCRSYCIMPGLKVIYDASCLADIQYFLNQLMQERKSKKEK